MGSQMLKYAILAMLMLFGVVAMFLGLATGWMALSSGEITFTSSAGSDTVRRLTDPVRFWRNLGVGSLLPLLGGGLALWYGRRGLNRL